MEEKIQSIIKQTSKTREEIEIAIEKKINEFNNLITRESALAMILTELGMKKETNKINIKDLEALMSEISITGEIVFLSYPQYFKRKDDTQGALQKLIIKDDTGFLKIILWGEDFKTNELKKGDNVTITKLNIKENNEKKKEAHSSSNTEIKKEDEVKKNEEKIKTIAIKDIKENMYEISIEGKVVEKSEIKKFIKKDGLKGQVQFLEVMDNTGSCKINFWNNSNEKIEKIAKDDVIKISNVVSDNKYFDNINIEIGKYTEIKKTVNESLKKIKAKQKSEAKEYKINQIKKNNELISFYGKIEKIDDVKEFIRKTDEKGQLKKITIKDNTDSIEATFWNEKIKLLEKLKIGDIVHIENIYSKENEYGLSLNSVNDTTVSKIKEQKKIEELKNIKLEGSVSINEVNIFRKILDENITFTDIEGEIIKDVEIKEFERKNGKKGVIASTFIEDEENIEAKVIAWNEHSKKLENVKKNSYVKITNLKAKNTEYGLELTMQKESDIILQKDKKIKKSIDKKYKIKELKDNNIKIGQKVQISCTLMGFNEGKEIVYPLCNICNKKMTKKDNKFICEQDQEGKVDYRYIVNANLEDDTDKIKGTLFGKVAEDFIGLSPKEFYNLAEEQKDKLDEIKSKLYHISYDIKAVIRKNRIDDAWELNIINISKI